MRKVSLKRAKLNRSVKVPRAAYMSEHPLCQWCQSVPATELHEIARGVGTRVKSIAVAGCWLHLCREHHSEMGDYSIWPVARQMALAELVNPYFNREETNLLRGRAPNAICQQELDDWKSTL